MRKQFHLALALALAALTAGACKDDESSDSKDEAKATGSGSSSGSSSGSGSTVATGSSPSTAPAGSGAGGVAVEEGTPTPKGADAVFRTLYTAPARIQAWALAPNGKFAVVSFDNGTAKIGADLTTAMLCSTSVSYNETRLVNLGTGADRPFSGSSFGTKFSPDGGSIIFDQDGTLKLANLSTDADALPADFGIASLVTTLSKSAGHFIGSELATERLFKGEPSGKRTFYAPPDLASYEHLRFIGITSDESRLYFAGVNATAAVLHEVDITGSTPRAVLNFAPNAAFAMAGDDAILVEEAAGSNGRKLTLRDARSGAERAKLGEGESFVGIAAVQISASGTYGVITGGAEAADQAFLTKDGALRALEGKAIFPAFLGDELLLKRSGDTNASARSAAGALRVLSTGLDVQTVFAANPTSYAVLGVNTTTRYETVRVNAKGLTEPKPIALGLAAGRKIERLSYGPKGDWAIAWVISGSGYVPAPDPQVEVSMLGRDSCGGLDGILEAYLVRADGSEAIKVYGSEAATGGSPGDELKFDDAETRLLLLSGKEIKVFDLPQ